MPTDWQELSQGRSSSPAVVDPRRRLRWCLGLFVLLLMAVWCRAVQLEIGQGAAFRADALRPNRRESPLPAARGRILARDGTVLACDREVAAVAVEYRYLEEPPRRMWLEQLARQRLPKDQRRNSARLAEEVQKLRQARDELHHRLAALCGIELPQWQARAWKAQQRVERIAADVRQRRMADTSPSPGKGTDASWAGRWSATLHNIFGPARDAVPETVTVAEELTEHVLAEDIPATAAAEIQQHPDRYPGARIVRLTRRAYPEGNLAAHVVGYTVPLARRERVGVRGSSSDVTIMGQASSAPPSPPAPLPAGEGRMVGLTGIEQRCEAMLSGKPGVGVELTDHAGRVQQAFHETEAVPGRDVTLTIDPRLQRTAEELLDSAIQRAALQSDQRGPSGGAVVVIDVHNGEILALASAPRFDPAAFADRDSSPTRGTGCPAALLADPTHPLFHRAIQMALPPGAVFKTVTAVALLESGGLDPTATFHCQGYLIQPDRQRCAVFIRHGMGHGDVTLSEALAEDCNVYFFHHAEALPPQVLVDWSRRLGFGQPTGVDLPGEAHGIVPAPDSMHKLAGHGWHPGDTQAMAVGQGPITATPLQVVRMMAAVANGGLLVTPHVVESRVGFSPPGRDGGLKPTPQPVPGLTYPTLAVLRTALVRTVANKDGTAYRPLDLPQVSIAGSTGPAVIGDGQPGHAWFAGYVPADRPRYAMVVVLERAGDGGTAACPVAKRLVLRMLEIGLLKL